MTDRGQLSESRLRGHPGGRLLPGRPKPDDDENNFPAEPATDYYRCEVTLPLTTGSDALELLSLVAVMGLDRAAPSRNTGGHRQFEFRVAAWEAAGEARGTSVGLTLADTIQPRSVGLAHQREADYPATLVLAFTYDAYIGGSRVSADLAGLGIASGIIAMPPLNPIHLQVMVPLGAAGVAFAGQIAVVAPLTAGEFDDTLEEVRAARLDRRDTPDPGPRPGRDAGETR